MGLHLNASPLVIVKEIAIRIRNVSPDSCGKWLILIKACLFAYEYNYSKTIILSHILTIYCHFFYLVNNALEMK